MNYTFERYINAKSVPLSPDTALLIIELLHQCGKQQQTHMSYDICKVATF